MADEDEHLLEITRCSLCNDTSRVPKRLPCFHIFCINCLEKTWTTSRAHLDKKLPCPVCKTDFSFPTEGFGALQTDSFVQRLRKVNSILNLSSGNLSCDACQEDNDTDTAHEIPLAHTCCVSCCMRLCSSCCRVHERSELTRDHTLINLINQTISKELMETLTPNTCVNHTKEQLKLFCSDCKSVVCAICYIERHQNHSWSEVESAVSQFRIQVQNNAGCLSRCGQNISNKIQLLQREKSDTIRRTDRVKTSVLTAKLGLKMLLDTHADNLIYQIETLKASKLAEIETNYEDFTRKLSTLKSCLKYVEELQRKGSSSDFCQVSDNLAETVADLENFSRYIQTRQVNQLRIDFNKSKLEDVLTTCGGNSVGTLYVDQGVTTQDENRECWLEDILLKPEKLQQELNKSKVTIYALKSTIECLNQHLNNMVSVIDKQKLELDKEKYACMSLRSIIEQKNEELCKERKTTDKKGKEYFDVVMKTTMLQTIINEVKEKLDNETQSNTNLQKIIENQKQELESEKVANISLSTKFEKSQKELKECRIQVEEIRQAHEEHINELNVAQEKQKNEWATIANLLQNNICEKDKLITEHEQMVKHLEEQLELVRQKDDSVATTTKGKETFRQKAVLVQVLKTKQQRKPIWGLTIMDNELFIVIGKSSQIEVYDSLSYRFKQQWEILQALTDPQDIVSCASKKCLFIMNWGDEHNPSMILKVNPNGKLLMDWSLTFTGGRLSITQESTVIVTTYGINNLYEYSLDGELINEIKIHTNSLYHPQHSEKVAVGRFLICCGSATDFLNRVCLVDQRGNVLKSFGGERGSDNQSLNRPMHLAVDGDGYIFVADWSNRRVLLLNSDLDFQTELLTRKAGLKHPGRIFLDQPNNRLLLANNASGIGPGQVLIFDIHAELL